MCEYVFIHAYRFYVVGLMFVFFSGQRVQLFRIGMITSQCIHNSVLSDAYKVSCSHCILLFMKPRHTSFVVPVRR